MRYKIRDEKCPYCGGSEFIKAMQVGQGGIIGIENAWSSTSQLNHVVCRSCGSIVRSYVGDPEKLLKRKNRRIED